MVATAMRRYPELIGGSTHAASLAMRNVPGLICKNGAEGVWAAALPDGRAFAAKIDDGGARALPALLGAVLTYWGVAPAALAGWADVPVLGGRQPVGALRCPTRSGPAGDLARRPLDRLRDLAAGRSRRKGIGRPAAAGPPRVMNSQCRVNP